MEWDFGFVNSLNEYQNGQLQNLLALLNGKVFDFSKEDEFQWVHSVDKIAIFHWQTVQEGVPVKEVLGYRRCLRDITNDKCGWCLAHVESIDHLFLHCSWSYKVWSSLFNWWNVCWILPSNILEFSHDWCDGLGIRAKIFWKLISPATIWTIWMARNELVFNGSYMCWVASVERIKIKLMLVWCMYGYCSQVSLLMDAS
ncbi:uncharacterized protein [Rutidosis leptorrhynchoides]|uniref:uncharacterized protein n=1 Tax=Rutidosis leptorrhynchoides TaxID=125765 RepID=UPI003A990ACC